MKINVDLVKYAQVAQKGIEKLFVRAQKVAKDSPNLLKGIDYTKSKIGVLAKDTVTFLTKGQRPDGFITKTIKFLESNYTTLVTNAHKLKVNLPQLSFNVAKS